MNMGEERDGEERRKNAGLSQEQLEAIKEHVLASVYEDIGRSLVKKALWGVGAVFVAVLTWVGANHISLK